MAQPGTETYQGEFPPGADGEARMRERLSSSVLRTGPSELSRDELNELLEYLGFVCWDLFRAGAGPDIDGSELVPRAGAQTLGWLQCWQRFPALLAEIAEQRDAGELGSLARRDIGDKLDHGHVWACGVGFALGRGVSLALGRMAAHELEDKLRAGLGFVRGLYTGLRGDDGQPMFAAMDGYRAAVLEPKWVERFTEDAGPVGDGLADALADTERASRLVHADSRLGLSTTGPYPAGDGGFWMLHGHVVAEPLYHWADVTEGLPYSVSYALHYPAGHQAPTIWDSGVSSMAGADGADSVAGYLRDRWDAQPRPAGADELAKVGAACRAAARLLHRRFAAMPRRDAVLAGAQVVYLDALAPFARAAGVWDQLRESHDVHELDPEVSEAYYQLVRDGRAEQLASQLILTGTGFTPVREPISTEEAMPALHLLAVRGSARELPVDPAQLSSAGFVQNGADGYELTETGRSVHARALENERRGMDTARMDQAYERFLALDERMEALARRWPDADESTRRELLGELADVVSRVKPALRRASEELQRFEPYLPRLRRAVAQAEQGDFEYVESGSVESAQVVWQQLKRDYQLTLGTEE
jgi:hypothetical protein